MVDDEKLIAEYEAYHVKIWPEIEESIKSSGILNMEIYRIANCLFMLMEVTDDFTFEAKAETDLANPKVQEWEQQSRSSRNCDIALDIIPSPTLHFLCLISVLANWRVYPILVF